MKSILILVSSLLALMACGRHQEEQNSELNAQRFSISVLGMDMGTCTQEELSRFVAGQYVESISGKLPREQQLELRQKFSRVLKFPSYRADEAIASATFVELNKILESVFARSYTLEKVNQTFVTSVQDNTFTLLEFLSNYPVDELKVNGLAFMAKKSALEENLLKLQAEFN